MTMTLNNSRVVEFASCEGLKMGVGGHGEPVVAGVFKYFGGTAQGIGGIPADEDFIRRLLFVFDAESFDDIFDGRNCIILHDNEHIYRISSGSRSFDIEAWLKAHE